MDAPLEVFLAGMSPLIDAHHLASLAFSERFLRPQNFIRGDRFRIWFNRINIEEIIVRSAKKESSKTKNN